MRPPLRTLLAGALGLAVLSLSACTDDEPTTSGDGTQSPSESTESTPSASPSVSESPPATGSTAFPGVTPAIGPELALDMTRLHAPEGWKLLDQVSASSISAGGRGGRVQLIEMEGAADIPLESRAQIFLEGQADDAKSERLPNVTLGEPGLEAVRFRWTVPGDDTIHEAVLTWQAGTSITLNFDAAPSLLKREPDLVESVLASVEWVS